jgi:hypothetical protein
MPLQTRAQLLRRRTPRGTLRGDRHIDWWQGVLVQSKRLARQALDAIAGDGAAEYARRDGESETRMSVMIREHRQNEISIGEPPASLFYRAKFCGLMQTLGGLERQFSDRSSIP